jgi:hypothetical protein
LRRKIVENSRREKFRAKSWRKVIEESYGESRRVVESNRELIGGERIKRKRRYTYCVLVVIWEVWGWIEDGWGKGL